MWMTPRPPSIPDADGGTGPAGGADLAAFMGAWLRNRRLSGHTQAAYGRDITAWLHWCAARDADPLRASFLHVNEYGRALESTVDARTGRPPRPATVARKLSALSSFYEFLVKVGAVRANPVAGADRPRVGRDHSATVGLTPHEVATLLAAAARQTGPAAVRNLAVLTLLADLGLRVGEVIGLDLADLGFERGHRSVRFVGKGGLARRRALAPGTAAALDGYLTVRGGEPGPLFVTASGARLDRHAVFRLVRRLAKAAGIPGWARLSPHSLRHAFATAARAAGVALEDVQDAMGHADPRTTRRYDRDRYNLDRDPAYVVSAGRPDPAAPRAPQAGGDIPPAARRP